MKLQQSAVVLSHTRVLHCTYTLSSNIRENSGRNSTFVYWGVWKKLPHTRTHVCHTRTRTDTRETHDSRLCLGASRAQSLRIQHCIPAPPNMKHKDSSEGCWFSRAGLGRGTGGLTCSRRGLRNIHRRVEVFSWRHEHGEMLD